MGTANTSAAYEKLIAYKTGNYGQQSIADVLSAISTDDKNHDFFATTMFLSSNELYCEHMGEEFTCFVDLNVSYAINNPKLVTVTERDKAFLTFKKEMQNYLNGLSEVEITACEIYWIEISDAGQCKTVNAY